MRERIQRQIQNLANQRNRLGIVIREHRHQIVFMIRPPIFYSPHQWHWRLKHNESEKNRPAIRAHHQPLMKIAHDLDVTGNIH